MAENKKDAAEKYMAMANQCCGSGYGCCGGCGHMGMSYSRHSLARWLLGIIAIGLVFAFGFKLGEIKALLSNDFSMAGYPTNMKHDRMLMMWQAGYDPAMSCFGQAGVRTNTASQSSTTKPKP
jgi:hypothetical protein